MRPQPRAIPADTSVFTLFGDVLRQAADLFRKEAALFRGEMEGHLSQLLGAIGFLAAGLIFAIVAVSLVFETAVDWLAVELGSKPAASVICAVAAAAVAAAFFLVGRRKASLATRAPARTSRSVGDTGKMLAEKVSS